MLQKSDNKLRKTKWPKNIRINLMPPKRNKKRKVKVQYNSHEEKTIFMIKIEKVGLPII